MENFLRLLENWSDQALTHNGSIIVMFPSQYATNFWQNTSNYYNAPVRVWSFDTNFETEAGLPPLTPKFPLDSDTTAIVAGGLAGVHGGLDKGTVTSPG